MQASYIFRGPQKGYTIYFPCISNKILMKHFIKRILPFITKGDRKIYNLNDTIKNVFIFQISKGC